MKKILITVFVFVAIAAIVFSPYLLAVDFVKYSPLVFIIWVLSIAYFLLIKRRSRRQLPLEPEEEEEPGKKDVSRETS